MKTALLLIGCFFCATTGFAQQPQPERKDYIIQALETQRNEALAKEAICRADDAILIADLRKQIAEMKDQIAKTAAEPKQ